MIIKLLKAYGLGSTGPPPSADRRSPDEDMYSMDKTADTIEAIKSYDAARKTQARMQFKDGDGVPDGFDSIEEPVREVKPLEEPAGDDKCYFRVFTD